MAFSTILRQLRRDNNMTQEDLADALGLTPQAISRWETGMALPDLAVLRKLAYIFEVTTDTLLEVDLPSKDERVREILLSSEQVSTAEARQILRDALNEYPGNPTLMHALVMKIYYRRDTDTTRRDLNEAVELMEYLQSHGYDDFYTLLNLYRETGQLDKGRALLETLGGYDCISQEMEVVLMEYGIEKTRKMQNNAYTLLTKLNWAVYELSLEDGFTDEQRIAMLEGMFEANRVLMPDEDPSRYNWQATHVPWQLAKRYSIAGDTEKAIHWLNVMRQACTRTSDDRFTLTSPPFAGLELKRNGRWGEDFMLDLLDDWYFDNIREDERFRRIYAELKENVG